MSLRSFFAGLATVAVIAALAAPSLTAAESSDSTLAGNGLLGVRFGARQAVADRKAGALLARSPRVSAATFETNCHVDATATWTAGLTLDFFRGKLVGYEVGPTDNVRLLALATARGLRVGESTRTARKLYPGKVITSWAQDGNFLIHTQQGKIAGYLKDAGPEGKANPDGTVETIGAGDEGCPAMSP